MEIKIYIEEEKEEREEECLEEGLAFREKMSSYGYGRPERLEDDE